MRAAFSQPESFSQYDFPRFVPIVEINSPYGYNIKKLPIPPFILKPLQEDGKNLLALKVSPGRSTPYYYKADGVMEAYIRVGNESVIAPDYIVNELILKGTNQSFDTLTTDAVKKNYSFTLLEATYLERTGLRFEPSD